MAATPADLMARLDELGISVTHHTHPPLFTVEDSRRMRGDLPGGHCKNLFLRNKKKQNWLVVTDEQRDIDLKLLGSRIDAGRLSFGSAERLQEVLGVQPGAVTPFALINDPDCTVRVVLDKEMLEHEVLNYHPLVNTETVAIRPDDLVRVIRSFGHEPVIVPL